MADYPFYSAGLIAALSDADARHILPGRVLTFLDHHSRSIIEDWKTT